MCTFSRTWHPAETGTPVMEPPSTVIVVTSNPSILKPIIIILGTTLLTDILINSLCLYILIEHWLRISLLLFNTFLGPQNAGHQKPSPKPIWKSPAIIYSLRESQYERSLCGLRPAFCKALVVLHCENDFLHKCIIYALTGHMDLWKTANEATALIADRSH